MGTGTQRTLSGAAAPHGRATNADTADLLHASRVVAAGQALHTAAATRALIEAYVARPEPAIPATPDTVQDRL